MRSQNAYFLVVKPHLWSTFRREPVKADKFSSLQIITRASASFRIVQHFHIVFWIIIWHVIELLSFGSLLLVEFYTASYNPREVHAFIFK